MLERTTTIGDALKGAKTHREWPLALVVLLGTLIAYWPALSAGFIWDDDAHLTANPCIVGPLGFRGIWTTSAATYYPLVLTTFWIEHALWGLNPLAYHLVNIAMHAACALLLWRVLRCLRAPGAWLGAILWAWHPVQVESVAWITELKNTQSCVFYLLAILFFLRWRAAGAFAGRKGTEWDYTLAWLMAALAILSKSSTVMLPVVLGLLWWWVEKQWRWRNGLRLAPFFFISGAAGLWTVWEQQFHSGALGVEWTQSWGERVAIAGKTVWFYLGKLLWPHPLIFIYRRWEINASSLEAYLPTAMLALVLWVLWWKRDGRMRVVFFCFAYFVVSLFPVMDFFKVYFFRYSFVGDHFQYLASLGPLALAGIGIAMALERVRKPFLRLLLCGSLLLTVGALSWRQCGMYADAGTLWRTTIERNPTCWLAHDNLGAIFLGAGDLDDAFTQLQEALAIEPTDPTAHYNLGRVFQQRGELDQAINQFQKAIQSWPLYVSAHNDLGAALVTKGRLDDAVAQFQKVVELRPDVPQAHYDLGNVLFQKGRIDDAISEYQRAATLAPDVVEVHYNLGVALAKKGKFDDAVIQIQKALAIQPGFARAQIELARIAWSLATSPNPSVRNGARAMELAQQADQFTGGDNLTVERTLAAAYAEAGHFPEAIATAQRALELAHRQNDPANARAIETQLKSYQSGYPYRDTVSGR